MECTVKTIFNKNAIDRLHPNYDLDSKGNIKWLIYVRGNSSNPNGVIDKLMEYCGKEGNYTLTDLRNSSNLFYIDYVNNNTITFINENNMLAKALLNCWQEVYVGQELSYKPEDWESAIIDYSSAELYENGNDETTTNELNIIGKLKILRDIYRHGWTPTSGNTFYYIGYNNDVLDKNNGTSWFRFLSFQNAETRDVFYDNYKDLIEQVKTYI